MQRKNIEIQPARIAIGADVQPGCLVLAEGALLAVLSCEKDGVWVVEAVFGQHDERETPETFADVNEIESYFSLFVPPGEQFK